MIKYTTVEDYLEVIAGIKDPVTLKKNTTHSFFGEFDPIVSLARYDTDVLNSMSTAVSEGRALTEKQGELAVKIVVKYKRQLTTKGIDVAPVEEAAQWRLPLRKMDYTRRLAVVGDRIVLNFPYSTELIDELRTFRRESQGGGEWDKENKQWCFALTEYNLVWLTTWAETRQFEFDDEARRLNQLITSCEDKGYAIELQLTDTGCDIANCPESLRDYINTHLGGFELENLLRLVDVSAQMGYTVSREIADLVVAGTDPRFYNLATSREIKLDPTTVTDDLASVLDYADRTQRWPVVVYEPDLSGKLLQRLSELRGQNNIAHILNKKDIKNTPPQAKYIHTVVPTSFNIPLLISSAGMIYGGDKSLMVQQAEKVVYCSAEVYNKAGQTKVQTIAG
jgi:hypothetical protein